MSIETPTFDYRAKPQDVCRTGEPVPFCQTHAVRTVFPLKDCVSSPKYLINVRGNFRTGDFVTFVRHVNDNFDDPNNEVTEIAKDVCVRYSDSEGVDLWLTSQILYVVDDRNEKGVVVSRGFAGKFIVRLDGVTMKALPTIVEANEYAIELGRETGKPVTEFQSKKKTG